MEFGIYVAVGLSALCVVLLILLFIQKPWQKDVSGLVEHISRDLQDELDDSTDILQRNIHDSFADQERRIGDITKAQSELKETVLRDQREQTERINRILTESVGKLQESNEKKLDEMRRTVDEKLDKTLTDRLSKSFETVSRQLEDVYKGLGEMKQMSTDVSNLQRVLTNVKARGTWGEVQLRNILEQTLTHDQFVANFSPRNNSDRVEFAVKLPSNVREGDFIYLPIDSKFPIEQYQRIQTAADAADAEALASATRELSVFIKQQAKTIRDKYLTENVTTEFGILFLPTEGLYAEVLRIDGLAEEIQNTQRIMICGPTTITAFLNTVSVAFRMLALDQRADEVWSVLGAVKKQYETFSETLSKAEKKLDDAHTAILDAQKRTDIIQKKMRSVEATVTEVDANALLGIEINGSDED